MKNSFEDYVPGRRYKRSECLIIPKKMKGEFFRKMKQPYKAFMEYGKVIDIEVDISNRGYYVTAQDNAYQELYAYVEAISRV